MTLIVDLEVSKKEKLKGIQFFSNPKPSRFYGFGSKYAANTDDQSTKVITSKAKSPIQSVIETC